MILTISISRAAFHTSNVNRVIDHEIFSKYNDVQPSTSRFRSMVRVSSRPSLIMNHEIEIKHKQHRVDIPKRGQMLILRDRLMEMVLVPLVVSLEPCDWLCRLRKVRGG
jgi:hypothetical protein